MTTLYRKSADIFSVYTSFLTSIQQNISICSHDSRMINRHPSLRQCNRLVQAFSPAENFQLGRMLGFTAYNDVIYGIHVVYV